MRKISIIIAGGREFTDRAHAFKRLDDFNRWANTQGYNLTTIIHGDAQGADRIGRDWGNHHKLQVVAFPADWGTHGRSAGPIRNQLMLDQKPDFVITFDGGRGTAHMKRIATFAGVKVFSL
jgi:hypothetical protein